MTKSWAALVAFAALLDVASAARVSNKTVSVAKKTTTSAHAQKVVAATKTVATAATPVKPVVQATAVAVTHAAEMADLKRFAEAMRKENWTWYLPATNKSTAHVKPVVRVANGTAVAGVAPVKPVVQATVISAKHAVVNASTLHKFNNAIHHKATVPKNVTKAWEKFGNFLRHGADEENQQRHGADEQNQQKKPHDCQCVFKNFCTCEGVMEFMGCIKEACTSEDCNCHKMQYKHACQKMASTCPSLKMECSYDDNVHTAKCTDAINASALPSTTPEPGPEDWPTDRIMKDLEALKEEKCQLEVDAKNGWLNADDRVPIIQKKIDGHMVTLRKRNSKIPEMHCYKDFEEYEYPHPPPKAFALRATSSLALAAAFAFAVSAA
eukprot:gnl/TRDRNA2_/TRDRNA2_191233_c0_seq1.p1 gnl/TRDRNA2_/TRDRNA2_191233_c0~~gnl/TRDRNA2_/TRDRNA2_191233_c0_seq1.p1  ORF type:complete len:381 (+),score=88.59 gnl/TRDRNA2_/TRDRNA2_191233_c0_seq1:75-1217(+)